LTGEDGVTFGELLKMAREESHIMAVLSTILRLTNQSRDDSVVAKRAARAAANGAAVVGAAGQGAGRA
jgi:hypothetical protein